MLWKISQQTYTALKTNVKKNQKIQLVNGTQQVRMKFNQRIVQKSKNVRTKWNLKKKAILKVYVIQNMFNSNISSFEIYSVGLLFIFVDFSSTLAARSKNIPAQSSEDKCDDICDDKSKTIVLKPTKRKSEIRTIEEAKTFPRSGITNERK